MLEAWFSGRHVIKTEADGSVFIDRDGEHFKIILNYLRDGKIPDGIRDRPALAAEAAYYGLEHLMCNLRELDYQEVLGEEIRIMRGSAARLRRQFYSFPATTGLTNSDTLTPHAGLVSLFVTRSPLHLQLPTLTWGLGCKHFKGG